MTGNKNSRALYQVTIPEFKTHVKQSKHKDKKINGQSIYTGSHHRVRYLLMKQIHEYLKLFIKKHKTPISKDPVELHVEVHAPINYGDVRKRKGIVLWDFAKEGYEPSWDLDNFSWIWVKGIQDVLQKQNVLEDDTVKFIRRVSYEFIPVEDLKDRKLVITVYHSEVFFVRLWKKLFNKKEKNGEK